MSMVYTILLGSTASTETVDNPQAQKALSADVIRTNLERWTKELCAVFGGCTMQIVDGHYVMDNGKLCTESSFQFTCYLMADISTQAKHDAYCVQREQAWIEVQAIAEDMCKVFGQECVLVSKAQCNASLVRA